MKKTAAFTILRNEFLGSICKTLLANVKGYPNMADVSSKSSIYLANGIIKRLKHPLCAKPPSSQTIGSKFSLVIKNYLNNSFALLSHLRPGKWHFSVEQGKIGIAAFDQYRHLMILEKIRKSSREFAASIDGDYLVIPDIIIAREPVSDEEINNNGRLLEKSSEKLASHTPLRAFNYESPNLILHASISCKWTIRSDRSQNTRTEALNLIRNRKGNTPHIVAVTAEPLPTRIASIAMGTGDIDCVYHMALYELIETAKESEFEDQYDMLKTLIDGRRLRDISDLVFDLAI